MNSEPNGICLAKLSHNQANQILQSMSISAPVEVGTATATSAATSIAEQAAVFSVYGFPVPYPYPTQPPPPGLLWPSDYPYPLPPPFPGAMWLPIPFSAWPSDIPEPPGWPEAYPWPPVNATSLEAYKAGQFTTFPRFGTRATQPYIPISNLSLSLPTASSLVGDEAAISSDDGHPFPTQTIVIISISVVVALVLVLATTVWWIRRKYFALKDARGRALQTKLMPTAENAELDDFFGGNEEGAVVLGILNGVPVTAAKSTDSSSARLVAGKGKATNSVRSLGWSEIPTLSNNVEETRGVRPTGSSSHQQTQAVNDGSAFLVIS
ncbi:hypothetical protein BC830DRAFT_1232640 [Chytriomyces sp. MP71]|nr:hypothetical protein BC830DRAFT_1232640 [Chytriomyces sp. MP71]